MSESTRHLCNACQTEEYKTFSHTCIHESMAQNDIWLEKYSINSWPRWDYSMEAATLTFSENGEAKVVCDIEVVGSTTADSWEWSWGNETLPTECRTRMGIVFEFGEHKQWNRLTTLFLESDEYVGWECASVASHILGGIGVYKCPSSDGDKAHAVYVVVVSAKFAN
jgi:hypothetical protein